MNPDQETISWMRVITAFVVVGGLMGLLGFVLKYLGQKGLLALPPVSRNNDRLSVVESLPLDVKRRLVIVRCDEKEHLLLLGTNQDIVVESNLKNASSVTGIRSKSSA